ncbi:MAG: hypothetical protein R3330_14555, partial [Saprospiraceae bacterium]|nr:hypothetical protein [Saprospiraceae bacterium]
TETAPPTDIFERAVNQLDFVASKQFGSVKLKFSAMNLINPDIIKFIPFAGEETITGQFRKGRLFSLSAQFRI